jgi:opacity protein-like surface antigen
MKFVSPFVLLVFVLIFNLQSHAQHQIGLYGGLLDNPGIWYEYRFTEHLGVHTSASYRWSHYNELIKDDEVRRRQGNSFINASLRYYNSKKRGEFFHGPYLRYWLQSNGIAGGESVLNAEQIQWMDSLIISKRNVQEKFSLGYLLGMQYQVGPYFTFGFTLGLGFSPKSFYWNTDYYVGNGSDRRPMGPADFIGYLNHMSGIGQVQFGYKW